MKIIELVTGPCNCTDKLWDFYERHNDNCGHGQEMIVGTKVECDCGTKWELYQDTTYNRLRWK